VVNARSGRWIAPAGDAAKVNVDGGISSLGEKGVAAAVARDKNGHFLGASVVFIAGLVNPVSLEAHACSEALALTQDLNLQRLVVASDWLGTYYKFQEWSGAILCIGSGGHSY
jgi:hypothetical protein